MPVELIALAPLLPWGAAAWIALAELFGGNRGEAAERTTARLTSACVAISFALIASIGAQSLYSGAPGQITLAPWLRVAELRIDISFMLDGLGLSLGVLVALISFFGLRFSINYLHREAGFQRFFMILCLFIGAMELIVLAGNAALMFIAWELAGISSYLLIAYAYQRPSAGINATRAFIANRIGDSGFILGIFLGFLWHDSVAWPALTDNIGHLDALSADLIALAFLLAALAKSAQLPFAAWISRALEGPTPSSAVFYGSLMVHAGVYLLIRLDPLLQQAPAVQFLIALLGLLSAVYAWLAGLAQNDVKSSLMFSGSGQVGLMFFCCGIGWSDLAAWHLALHAVWRAYQFLHAPALMHLANRPMRPVARWLARSRRLHTAALHRFWLDPCADWLLVRPTRCLSRDVQNFDEQVINRAVGLPAQASVISSLAQWEARKRAYLNLAEGDIATGRGILGGIMEWVATLLHWFEERLVLRGGGEGLLAMLHQLGGYLTRIEQLLSQPRYLLLLIMATFVVIL